MWTHVGRGKIKRIVGWPCLKRETFSPVDQTWRPQIRLSHNSWSLMSLRRNCRFTGRFGVYDGVYYPDRDLQKKIWNVKNARQDGIVFVSQSGPACRSIGPLTRLSHTARRVRATQRNHHTNTTNSLFQWQAHLTRPQRRSETVLNISLIRQCNSGILTNFRIKDVNSQGSFYWRVVDAVSLMTDFMTAAFMLWQGIGAEVGNLM